MATVRRSSSASPNPPVLFFHGDGTAAASAGWLEQVASLGLRCFSHREIEGVEKTEATLHQFGALCAEIADKAPGQALLVLRAGLEINAELLQAMSALLARAPGVGVYTLFSNASPAHNPFAGLPYPADPQSRRRLLRWLGSNRLYLLDQWPSHFLALTAAALEALADGDLPLSAAAGRLRDRRVQVEIPDWLWLEDPANPPHRAAALAGFETARPRPWAELSERLASWLEASHAAPGRLARLPAAPQTPATLHITHSWGGGVATWVNNYIDSDPAHTHFQLRSEGPQSGDGAGQRLALYLGTELHTPLDRWWMQPPIEAVDTVNGQYREMLEDICERYGIGRLLVSSLIGHSLDALRTELPTLQILHDHFPVWPLLDVHPQRYDFDLTAACREQGLPAHFQGQSLEDWRRIKELYQDAARHIIRVAPSASARDVQARLDSSLDKDSTPVIRHGMAPLTGPEVRPRERSDGRLRLVILGRLQAGKGASLLAEALPELTRHAQVTLVGTGADGEQFFGLNDVNVIVNYQRDELPALLAQIGPHCAALLSLVPETFSYALSELQALHIPVLATRVGSFTERIEDGINGWLIEPDSTALCAKIAALAAAPETLKPLRESLKGLQPQTLVTMREAYEALCPLRAVHPGHPRAHDLGLSQADATAAAGRALDRQLQLIQLTSEALELNALVDQRTRWAESEKKALASARKERSALMAQGQQLETELKERAAHIEAQNTKIQAMTDARETAERKLREQAQLFATQASRYARLQSQHQQVIHSRSWRLTRPLRVARRMPGQMRRLQVWNPLRWPVLFSQLVRSVKTVGWRGVTYRLQRSQPPQAGPSTTVPVTEAPVLKAPDLPAALPCSPSPRVSIIIPAYNELAYTAACLKSIADSPCDTAFEVIVVDDESRDETAATLSELEGLRFLRNEQNQGFIRSCNRGAAEARGEYVLFLNNDTQVQAGWLDTLLATFEQYPEAGLVGARLVYPDGTLQECGGMVFNDGSGWNYGRGDQPDRPEYQAVREVDYCSGACIALPRALWQELGGFDELYAPAYYEDTDLAFKVRAAGRKVYVQPATTVVHFEGISSGTDLTSGTKRYQVINREKFEQRWAEALEHQPAPIVNPDDLAEVRRARDHRLAGRILIIDAYTPEPDQDSGSVRLVNLMRCLVELGHGVCFLAHNRAWAGRYTQDLQALGVECWYAPWAESTENFFAEAGSSFDQVIISRHYIACHYTKLLEQYAPQADFIFDTVDLHYLREERLAELENSTALRQVAKQTRRAELAMIRAADATLVVSPVEQELLREVVPEARVFILSNIHELAPGNADYGARKDLYFVGGYQHPPNVDAACWFVEEIWPLVHARLPGVQFHLIGSKAPDEVAALGAAEGVKFHGFVETLEPFLDQCRLSVAPLRYGAGVKGKVNQAMAHGQPVVATSAAVEGIHAEHGKDVMVADEATAFADAVVQVYEDATLWQTLADNGLANVQAHFSKDAAKANIQTLLQGLRD